MFCPRIKAECRTDCVKWEPSFGKCREEIVSDLSLKANQMMEFTLQIQRVTWRLQVRNLMNDPMVPADVKEAIQEAKDLSTIEKLLGDAGLLD